MHDELFILCCEYVIRGLLKISDNENECCEFMQQFRDDCLAGTICVFDTDEMNELFLNARFDDYDDTDIFTDIRNAIPF